MLPGSVHAPWASARTRLPACRRSRMLATYSPRPAGSARSSLRGSRAPTPVRAVTPLPRAAAGSRRPRRGARPGAGRNAARSMRSVTTCVPSLSRRAQRPRSSCSTLTSAAAPGLRRADLALHAEHLRRVGGDHRHDRFERQAEREHRGHRRDEREARLAEEHVLLVGVLVGRAGGRRHAGVVAVHVGAERVGHDAGVERDARHPVAEMRAVADVGLEPARERFLDDRVHLALAVHEAAGMAREGMREDVAGLQERHDLLEDRVGIDAVGRRTRAARQSWPKWM